jgi:hypothetical protein
MTLIGHGYPISVGWLPNLKMLEVWALVFKALRVISPFTLLLLLGASQLIFPYSTLFSFHV